MDKEFNWLADVILGSSDEITPPAREVPDLPLDDPLFKARRGDSIPRASAIDDLCAKLDLDMLVSTLCPIDGALEDARLAADVERFSRTPKAAPGLETIMEEVLPTSRVLAEWTPVAGAMFWKLIKSAQPSRQSEHKVCKLRYTLKDGMISCCPVIISDNHLDAVYKDRKTGKVFSLQANVSGIEACKDHCEAA
ncbi:MAG: hypothetical protein WBQ40_04295 [Candidatus Sulfotelmatobacter sp.]